MVCLQHYLQGNMIRRGPGCGMYSSRQSCTPDINSCGIVRGAMQEWICEGYAGVELWGGHAAMMGPVLGFPLATILYACDTTVCMWHFRMHVTLLYACDTTVCMWHREMHARQMCARPANVRARQRAKKQKRKSGGRWEEQMRILAFFTFSASLGSCWCLNKSKGE